MLLVSTDSYFIRRADYDVWTIAFIWGVASAVALGTLAVVQQARASMPMPAQNPKAMLLVAALLSGSQISFTAAINNTAVANAVVIIAAAPIFAALLAWIVLKEATERRVVIAIGLVLCGVGLVVSGSLGAPTLSGDLLALLAIVLFAGSIVLWRQHPQLNRPRALATSSVITMLISAPFASVFDAPLRVFVAAGLMGLVFNTLGRLSYTQAPKHAPAAEVALFAPVETVAATTWAWLFFDEAPVMRTVIGGVVVLAAVIWGTVGGSRRSRPTPI